MLVGRASTDQLADRQAKRMRRGTERFDVDIVGATGQEGAERCPIVFVDNGGQFAETPLLQGYTFFQGYTFSKTKSLISGERFSSLATSKVLDSNSLLQYAEFHQAPSNDRPLACHCARSDAIACRSGQVRSDRRGGAFGFRPARTVPRAMPGGDAWMRRTDAGDGAGRGFSPCSSRSPQPPGEAAPARTPGSAPLPEAWSNPAAPDLPRNR
jgi:hypothetical protein